MHSRFATRLADVFHRGPGYLPPHERAPEFGTCVSNKNNLLDTHVFQVDAQVKAFNAYLQQHNLATVAALTMNAILKLIFLNHALVGSKMFSDPRWKAPTPSSWTTGTNSIINYQKKKRYRPPVTAPAHGRVFGELWDLLKKLGCTLSGAVTGDFAALACAGKYSGYQTCKKAMYVAMTPISSLVTKLTGWAAIYDVLDEAVKGAIGCCFGMGSVIERSIKKGVMLLRMNCGTFRGAAQLDVPLCPTYQETRDVKDVFSSLLSRALVPDAWMFIGVASAAYMGQAVVQGAFAGAVFFAGGFEAWKMSLAGVLDAARQDGLAGALFGCGATVLVGVLLAAAAWQELRPASIPVHAEPLLNGSSAG